MKARTAAFALMLGCGAAAQAADNGVYIGAAISQAQIDGLGEDVDLDDTGYKLIVGFRPLDRFAVEVNYMDLGEDEEIVNGIRGQAEAKAIAGYGVLYFTPIPFLDLYGKAGLAYWEAEGRSDLAVERLKDDGTEFAWGAGVQARFGSIAARLEYESFDVGDSDGVDLYSLGATWTFL